MNIETKNKCLHLYEYKVIRRANRVYYTILRDGDFVTDRQVYWHDIPFFKAILMPSVSERAIRELLKIAHEKARYAIDAMIEFET